jgi:exopolysaccharide biosynthesis polyprenyl glycosylphosphotransferase
VASKEAEGIALGSGVRLSGGQRLGLDVPGMAVPGTAARPDAGTRRGSRGLGAWRHVSALQLAEARGPAAGLRRDSLFRRLLLFADLSAIATALSLVVALAPESLRLGSESLLVLPMVMAAAKLFGLYDRDEALIRKATLDETPKLLQMSTLCTLAVWIADRPILDGSLRRSGALLLWGSLTVLLVALRSGARWLGLRLAPVERCLFIGDIASERRIRSKLADGCGTKATIVAHLELHEAAPWSSDAFSPGRLAEIRELAQTLDIHRAIVAPGSADGGDMLDLVCALKAVGVRVSVLPRLLEVMGSAVEFDDLHGLTVMGLRRFALTRSTALLKRAFDLVAASAALVAALPLMAVVAIAIKLDSKGPVFFRQLRVGRNGERFRIFKFRTMICGAEHMREQLADRNEAQEGLFKIAEDPRVTRVGALLRKSCLDELPQFVNVLLGQMSLVGPRPLVVEEDALVEGRHRRRLELLPGITGHWQILGPARVPLREMAAMDYLYVANWSLWTDVKILLRTVPHVVARRGM